MLTPPRVVCLGQIPSRVVCLGQIPSHVVCLGRVASRVVCLGRIPSRVDGITGTLNREYSQNAEMMLTQRGNFYGITGTSIFFENTLDSMSR
jgi:hypothetical protein